MRISRHSLVLFFFVACYLLNSSHASAQTQDYLQRFRTGTVNSPLMVEYWKQYVSLDAEYRCVKDKDSRAMTIQRGAYDTLLRPVLSNVFVGSNDLVKNTTAASFVQDDKAGTLNANYALLKNSKVLNIGAFSKSSGGLFGVYTGGSWSSDVGLTFGFSMPITSGQFFDPTDCQRVLPLRKAKMIEILDQVSEISKYNIPALQKDSLALKTTLNAEPAQATAGTYAQTLTNYQKVDSVLKLYWKYQGHAIDAAGALFPKVIRDSLTAVLIDWDVKNAAVFTGYTIKWWSINAAISNNSITPATDSLPAKFKKDYKTKNAAKVLLGLGLHFQWNSKRNLFYLGGSVNFGLHNYMDHPSIVKPYTKVDTLTGEYAIFNGTSDSLGLLQNVKANITTFEPSVNLSWFWGEAKRLGLNIRADFRAVMHRPDDVSKELYPNTFNLLLGPLFRLNADKPFGAGTLGLDIGFVDAPVKENVWDSFAFKFKVGIPINALIK